MSTHTDISGGLPQSGVAAFKLIDDDIARVKELIDKQLSDCDGAVRRLLESFSICDGKMLRPGLVLLAGAACGKIADEHIQIAAIAEIIHNATLLHDDVIDEGQKRRGAPTINSLWGNESAVLLGDFLLSQVFRMCVALEPEIIKTVAATTVRVCEGELRQVIQRQNWQLSESQYIDIITEKSAALFSGCCYLGAFLAEASETEVELLACFGHNVGVAFQITDDLLDIIADETTTGKTVGRDADKNKLTLAVIHLLRTVGEREKSAVIKKLNVAGENKEALVEMLRSHGSLEYAYSRAQEFSARAVEALAGLKESDAKDALIETAGFVGRRAIIS
jgi:octaprenyl-diphosphate synthase